MMPVVTEIPQATPSTTHHTLKQHHQLVNGGVSSPTSLLHNINMNSPSPSPLDVTFITSRANTAAPSSASRGAFLKPRAAPQCAPSSFSSRISSQYTSYAETEMEDIIINTKMISSPRDLISPTTTAIASFESIEYCSEIRPRKSSYDSSNGGAMYRYSSPTKMSGSPANTKLKTEMCRNILKIGYCQFKENCHFAHSKEELRKFETVEEMHEAGLITDPKNYMARPCFFGVSTGSWYVLLFMSCLHCAHGVPILLPLLTNPSPVPLHNIIKQPLRSPLQEPPSPQHPRQRGRFRVLLLA